MDKKNILLLIAFVLLATLLRLWHLDKPEGMWNDEYLTWQIANAKLPFDFFYALKTNCHAPLHYLYLKGWMNLFGQTDWSLRLSSVVPGVLSVISMFFVGLQFKGKKDTSSSAICVAFFTAISSFLIYFSQEVRIYSLVFLITSLMLLFALKIINNPSKKNFILYGIFSLLLMLTHTIGFIFVFFSTAALFLFAVDKKHKKDFLLYTVLSVVLLFLPFVPFIYTILFKATYFSQWWVPFSWAKLGFYFTDLFSPVVQNISNAPKFFIEMFYKDEIFNFGYFIFAIVPTIICFVCILRGLIKPKKTQYYLLSVFVAVFLTVLLTSLTGKIVFLTKYLIELYPILIVLAAIGWSSFKSKGLKIALATVFSVLSLFYLVVSHTSALRLIRDEGQRAPIVAIQKMDVKKNDKVLFLYYPSDRFDKYAATNSYISYHISKYDYFLWMSPVADWDKNFYKEGKSIYRDTFESGKNKVFENNIKNKIFSKLNKGDKFFIVDLRSVSFFPLSVITQAARYDGTYDNMPFLYLVMSYVKNTILAISKTNLDYVGHYDTNAWRIYVFRKT